MTRSPSTIRLHGFWSVIKILVRVLLWSFPLLFFAEPIRPAAVQAEVSSLMRQQWLYLIYNIIFLKSYMKKELYGYMDRLLISSSFFLLFLHLLLLFLHFPLFPFSFLLSRLREMDGNGLTSLLTFCFSIFLYIACRLMPSQSRGVITDFLGRHIMEWDLGLLWLV